MTGIALLLIFVGLALFLTWPSRDRIERAMRPADTPHPFVRAARSLKQRRERRARRKKRSHLRAL